jgi:molybdopterin-containing oxidoreductase family iron-sulfur binding subunit
MAKSDDKTIDRDYNRRGFLRLAGASLATAAAAGIFTGCDNGTIEEFFQKRFKELSREELQEVLRRLEAKHTRQFGREVTIRATPPNEGEVYGYGLDLSRCIGCRRCVYACAEENNLSRQPQIHWIKVLQMEKSHGIDVYHSNAYYNPEQVPQEDYFYMPVACQQCRQPPCTKTCPVQATWQEPDGIVVVDYNWCIGCRCCMAACPYGARRFNWTTPKMPPESVNPEMEYLGNRPQMKGVVSKCTFCIQRVRHGRYPACVEACPTGSRKFGNLLDPESEIRHIMNRKRVFILKEELGTEPKFYYFYAT